jgi:hypothetical protein
MLEGFLNFSTMAARSLSPCVLGEAIPRDGSYFLEVDTALILLASTETDGHV